MNTQDTTLPPLPEQERAEFEAWAKRRCFDLTILEDDESDEYKELETESAWEAWQARAAIAAQAPQPLDSIEQYRLQMAGISTAAIGYWKEGDGIHPDCDTLALRDVAKLYAKYDELYKAQQAQGVPTDHLPTKEHIRELAQEAADQVMEQAQVFASAWALVGGRFDSGNALEDAEEAKSELRTLVRSLADLAAETVRPAAAPQAEPQPEREHHAVSLGEAWGNGYRFGVLDERTSEANIGIAGFDAKVEPARQNPYGATSIEMQGEAKQKPLSDEQIREVWVEHGLDDEAVEDFARAIEAAHGIGTKGGKQPGAVGLSDEQIEQGRRSAFEQGLEPFWAGVVFALAAAQPVAAGRSQHDADSAELRSLCQARDDARRERDALRAELAGHEAASGHLSAMVDELRALLAEAMAMMKALHESASPDDGPEMNAIVPAGAFREFVDANAALMHKIHISPHGDGAAAPQQGGKT